MPAWLLPFILSRHDREGNIKYADKTVRITLQSTPEKFTIAIEDDGPGFSDTVRVFELFKQSSDSETLGGAEVRLEGPLRSMNSERES